jgi:hypothetical protein
MAKALNRKEVRAFFLFHDMDELPEVGGEEKYGY